MSQTATARPVERVPRPAARHPVRTAPPPPRLRVVAAPRHTRSRAGLVAGCVALLVLGLVGLLLLNVNLERGTYDLRDQQTRAEQLLEQKQKLELELQAAQAPQELATRAAGLGMVPAAAAPVFLTSKGTTIGVPLRTAKHKSPSVKAWSPTSSNTSAPSSATAKRGTGARDTAGATADPGKASRAKAGAGRGTGAAARPTPTPARTPAAPARPR